MTTSALIDKMLVNELELDSDQTNDAEQAVLRAQLLASSQEIMDQFCNYFSDADFLQNSFSSTVLSGARSFATDSTFESLGDDGGLWHDPDGTYSPGVEVRYLSPHEFFKLRMAEPTASSTRLTHFTISDLESTNTPTFHVHPKAAANILVVYRGRILPPTLVDTTGSTNGLDQVPSAYHHTIFLKGLRLMEAEKNGDGRFGSFDEWFEREMRRIKARRRNGLQEEQRLSSADGIWTYGGW